MTELILLFIQITRLVNGRKDTSYYYLMKFYLSK